MKIVILGYWFAEHIIELANGLPKTDEITIIMPEGFIATFRNEIARNVQIYSFSGIRDISIRNFKVMFRIRSIIDKINPDIIHIEHSSSIWTPIVNLLCRKYEVILTIHDPRLHEGESIPHKIQALVSLRLAVRFGSAFIVHGKLLRKQFIEKFRIYGKPVFSVSLGPYNSNIFEKYSLKRVEEKRNNILFFGRLRKYKGLNYLIEACDKLKNEFHDLTLTICGEFEPRFFKPYINQLKGKNYIEVVKLKTMRRPEDYEKASLFFRRSSIVVLPYITATGSAVIPNAYVFRKPVIASSTGGIPDMVINDVTGILVSPKDSDMLAEKIADLLNNEERRTRLGLNGYEYIKNEISTRKIAQMHKAIYSILTNQKMRIEEKSQ